MIWIILIILAILLIASTGNKGNRNRQTKPYRIDHPHYITDDERRKSGMRSLMKSAPGMKRKKGGKPAPVRV